MGSLTMTECMQDYAIMRGEWPENRNTNPQVKHSDETFVFCAVGYRLHAPRAKWDKHGNLARRIILKSFKISAAMRLKNQKCPSSMWRQSSRSWGVLTWHNSSLNQILYKKIYIYMSYIYIVYTSKSHTHTHTICIITLPWCMFKTKVLSSEGRNPPWIKRQVETLFSKVLAAQGPKHHFPPGQFCSW